MKKIITITRYLTAQLFSIINILQIKLILESSLNDSFNLDVSITQ